MFAISVCDFVELQLLQPSLFNLNAFHLVATFVFTMTTNAVGACIIVYTVNSLLMDTPNRRLTHYRGHSSMHAWIDFPILVYNKKTPD